MSTSQSIPKPAVTASDVVKNQATTSAPTSAASKSSQKAARRWQAEAPSNIALIKYMGKTEYSANRPTNTSLSYTLPHLKTYVELELAPSFAAQDDWQPLSEGEKLTEGTLSKAGIMSEQKYAKLSLSHRGLSRFLAHLQNLKTHFDFTGHFHVRSANDFPSDCGLASSASSFAALTRAACMALSDLTGRPLPSIAEQANWSRRGSGSSCRSFFSPWAIWTKDSVSAAEGLSFNDLGHQVIVVNEDLKTVSSSEAHKRVTTSLLFENRPNRAENRAADLLAALGANRDWQAAFEITWAEFWDMHSLFETSRPSFGYMTAGSLEVAQFVKNQIWGRSGDGPLITMDAGPNVHLLYKQDKAGRAAAAKVATHFASRFAVITSDLGEPRT